uniref:Uncharacterized protein n=1 Tax=Amphora coffeiformis TaxID=265554 RepID=A0A7S3KY33_9STRA
MFCKVPWGGPAVSSWPTGSSPAKKTALLHRVLAFQVRSHRYSSICVENSNILIRRINLASQIFLSGYIYPDLVGEGGTCDMYQGVSCVNDQSQCCYNEALWCPRGAPDCDRFDRGAYPFGDKSIYSDQMTNAHSLDPFPNAIFFNWATIFILGFGNLAALDFQSRCMAAKSAKVARWGCFIGSLVTVFVGVPFAYLGSITRVHYGPDSIHGEFEADSCALQLGLPTCALWLPDSYAFLKLLTHEAPGFLGAWCLVGIVAASMSTADGAILAMGTVFSHNIVRQLGVFIPGGEINDDTLLHMARVATLPFALMSGFIAAFYKGPGGTGYLLIVAFDIVLATVVVPLFGAFYTKNPSPRAALVSVVTGGLARIILEFAIPKDGSLLLPYNDLMFYDVGPAASSYVPAFIDAPAEDIWDPEMEPCNQDQFEDYTGVDSLAAAVLSLVVFCTIQIVEQRLGRQLFSFWGSQGYTKGVTKAPESDKETVKA